MSWWWYFLLLSIRRMQHSIFSKSYINISNDKNILSSFMTKMHPNHWHDRIAVIHAIWNGLLLSIDPSDLSSSIPDTECLFQFKYLTWMECFCSVILLMLQETEILQGPVASILLFTLTLNVYCRICGTCNTPTNRINPNRYMCTGTFEWIYMLTVAKNGGACSRLTMCEAS